MSNSTHCLGECGHTIYFIPSDNMRAWWCYDCEKKINFSETEKKIIMTAYNHGRRKMKETIKNLIVLA